ncbi:MAG TPA: class I SAM-dependent methyltransferase, partial [Thermodesulfobacteriota bacterium]|nr:class I SAM-dependent methyltransferase [Thermodesulfobacteriota bacterium]
MAAVKPGILTGTEFYDRLAGLFDVMTDWDARLNHEMPFLVRVLKKNGAGTVLDVACGTGRHAIALAAQGYSCMGCDSSRGMIAMARENARRFGADVRFEIADFSALSAISETFDAVLCLGNSLPHLLSRRDLDR